MQSFSCKKIKSLYKYSVVLLLRMEKLRQLITEIKILNFIV